MTHTKKKQIFISYSIMDLHDSYNAAMASKNDCGEVFGVMVNTELHVRNLFYVSLCFFCITWNGFSLTMVICLGLLYFYLSHQTVLKEYYIKRKIEEYRRKRMPPTKQLQISAQTSSLS